MWASPANCRKPWPIIRWTSKLGCEGSNSATGEEVNIGPSQVYGVDRQAPSNTNCWDDLPLNSQNGIQHLSFARVPLFSLDKSTV